MKTILSLGRGFKQFSLYAVKVLYSFVAVSLLVSPFGNVAQAKIIRPSSQAASNARYVQIGSSNSNSVSAPVATTPTYSYVAPAQVTPAQTFSVSPTTSVKPVSTAVKTSTVSNISQKNTSALKASVAPRSSGSNVDKGRIVVTYKNNVAATDKTNTVSRLRTARSTIPSQAKSSLAKINADVVQVDTSNADATLAALKSDPNVASAEFDPIATLFSVPNDPLTVSGNAPYAPPQDYQSSIYKMMLAGNGTTAWDINQGSPTIKIAIIDSGIDDSIMDLQGKVVAENNFVAGSDVKGLVNGHGTQVASVAAANTNNSEGITGVGYNSSLMNAKVTSDGDNVNAGSSVIASAIIWATDNGAKVINISLGSPDPSTVLQNAVTYAWNHNVVIVAGAGNNNNSAPFYPAAYPEVISVAATDQNDGRAGFSSYGSTIDVSAPGDNVFTAITSYQKQQQFEQTGYNFGYGPGSGTSLASPEVAGLAALIWASGKCTTNQCVRDLIIQNADPISATGMGSGRINALRSLQGTAAPETYSLTVIKDGQGTVNGEGISCGTDCSETTAQGAVINLTAITNAGQLFTGWTGACSGAQVTCSVTVDSAKTATAHFGTGGSGTSTPPTMYTLAIKIDGGSIHTIGRVGKEKQVNDIVTASYKDANKKAQKLVCDQAQCDLQVAAGTLVTLTPKSVLNDGTESTRFSGWKEDCFASGTACKLTVDANKSAQAFFDLKTDTRDLELTQFNIAPNARNANLLTVTVQAQNTFGRGVAGVLVPVEVTSPTGATSTKNVRTNAKGTGVVNINTKKTGAGDYSAAVIKAVKKAFVLISNPATSTVTH